MKLTETPPHPTSTPAAVNPHEGSKRWTIGWRISLGFASVLLVVLALGVFSYRNLVSIRRETEFLTQSQIPSFEALATVVEYATRNRLLVYKHLSSGDAADKQALEAEIAANSKVISDTLDTFQRLASPDYASVIERVDTERNAYLKKITEILAESSQATGSAAIYIQARQELDPIAARYAEALQSAVAMGKAESQQSEESIHHAIRRSTIGIQAALALAVGIGTILAIMITRSTARILRLLAASLKAGSAQITSAAAQVSASSQSLAEGASQQAASLEETSSSLEEMSSMTARNADNAAKAKEFAGQSRVAAESGVNEMQTMDLAMRQIKASSDEIAKIIKTIDEIAFQTNILALNAAVEAARAGDAGMGFAVVAEEVRALAQRSAQAAKETATKIESAITFTSEGVATSSKVAASLHEILEKVRRVDEFIADVASATHEQTQGVQQINRAVSEMDQVVQANASQAEESASAAEELNAQALTLDEAVSDLMTLVGHARATRAPVAPTGLIQPIATPRTSGSAPAARRTTGHARSRGTPRLEHTFTR